MNLGEKILKLRKEKGFSQESLAEKLGTTRQAISKWENNQGFPETEKLLQLSNIFGVSVDFLLKDEKLVKNTDEKGFYVSREMAKGFVSNQKKMCCYIATGFMAVVLSGIPYIMFRDSITWRYLGMAVCFVVGISAFVLGMFNEQEEYNILKQEPLLFDYAYLKELTNEYISRKRKYIIVAIPCTILFISGLIIFAMTKKGYFLCSEYHAFVFLGLAIGIWGFTYTLGVIEAYELLVKNEEYSTRLSFRLKRKIREKIDRL